MRYKQDEAMAGEIDVHLQVYYRYVIICQEIDFLYNESHQVMH